MDTVRSLQDQIIHVVRSYEQKQRVPIKVSSNVVEAFYKVPRHQFANRFFRPDQYRWVNVSVESVQDHLSYIYRDAPLIIYKDDGLPVSTISQPSFVLNMLQLLDLKQGHRVYELGTGSGWSAALMAELVGEKGSIDTIDIVPQLADAARERLKPWPQIRVMCGDGAVATNALNTYDRAVFTAGADDLPSFLFESVKRDGLVLFVMRNEKGADILFLLRKDGGHFHALRAMLCNFVVLQGHDAHHEDAFFDELEEGHFHIEDFDLDVYPADAVIPEREGQFFSRRSESLFVWTRKIARRVADG